MTEETIENNLQLLSSVQNKIISKVMEHSLYSIIPVRETWRHASVNAVIECF